MGLMNYLRNRAGVVIVSFIGFAIVAFLLGDVVNYGTPFWARQQNQVGVINGNVIDYNDFSQQVDQTTEMYRQQLGGNLNPQMRTWALDQVWSQFVNRELLNSEVEKIGLTVGKAELNELVSGNNPSYQILQAFSNPQTGQYDRQQLLSFISQVGTLPANHEAVLQWSALLENVVSEQLNMKYNSLVSNSVYVTNLEANDEYTRRNKLANFEYVQLDYASIADEAITLTDADYKAYYDENRKLFVNLEETRDLLFVEFDASPKAQDTLRVLEQVQGLATQLAETKADSLFAAVNSDTKYPFMYYKKGAVSPSLDSLVFKASKGTVVGPVYNNGAFEVAKVIDVRMSPDSIKASHILLNPVMEGGQDLARAKADSIRNLVRNGESFSALAIQFSVDEGSKVNGGELGTFPRGYMVPEFEEAVFDARKGEVIVVNSQFGVHIVKVEDVIGNSQVVKLAIIDKAITSGKETIDEAYSHATAFFGEVKDNDLVGLAQSKGLEVKEAKHVNGRSSMLESTMVKRDLVRWAFDAKKGDVSDKIYESENNDKYIVAQVTEIRPKGQLPLDAVKETIKNDVLDMVKAKQLTEKANAALAQGGDLASIASRLNASTEIVENIALANPVLPSVGMEYSVVGAAFGSELNKVVGPIKGYHGVYLLQVQGFVNPEAPTVLSELKRQLEQSQVQRTWNSVFKALLDNAKVTDNRARFF